MRTLVYPFDRQFLPVLRHQFYPDELEFTDLIAPSGWGYTNREAGAIDFGPSVGLLVKNNFHEALENVEAVFFTKSDHRLDKTQFILPKIKDSALARKDIYCTCDLSPQELSEFQKICAANGRNFHYINNNFDEYDFEFDEDIIQDAVFMRDITVPVVMVFGILESIGKFDTQIALTKYMRRAGHKTVLVASRSYGKLGGEYSVPHQMFGKRYTELQKMVYINHYIKNIELQTSPDVIIIGVPGGLMPVNKKLVNRFGITAYEMTKAVPPDAAIVCTYYDEYTNEYFEQLNNLCKYRFSSDVTGFVLDNTLLEFHAQATPDDVSFMNIPKSTISKLGVGWKNFSQPVRPHYLRDDVFKLTEDHLAACAQIQAY